MKTNARAASLLLVALTALLPGTSAWSDGTSHPHVLDAGDLRAGRAEVLLQEGPCAGVETGP